MIKQQSRAGSAGVTVSARRGGAVRMSAVRKSAACGGAGRKGAVGESAGRRGTVRESAGRKGTRRLAVPLIVPLTGVAVCLAACSSNSSSSHNASPATHETSMPKSGRSMSSVSNHSPVSPTGAVSPTVSPSLSAAACDHVHALRQDLISVTHIKYNSGTAKVVVVDLTDIRKQLTALKGEPALATEVGALTGALTNVQGAITAMSTPPTAAQLKAVATSFNNMKIITSPIIPKLKAACP